ncbi:MAG: hypothetical protein EAZ53_13235 [Bacteroidetes bacterium]|nr:MAG: hypothetical protein EAZ53_13235 [Bacteroidota bacterium]
MKNKFIILASLSIFGCSKSIETANPIVKNVSEVKNNMLNFKNIDDFKKLIEEVDPQKGILHNGEKFNSYYDYQNAEQTQNARMSADTSIVDTTYFFDSRLASVLNTERKLSINNEVFLAGNDYSFMYPTGADSLVDKFYSELKSNKINFNDYDLHKVYNVLKVQKTELKIISTTISKDSIPQNLRTEVSYEKEAYFSSDKRVQGTFWGSTFLFYGSCGIETKMQKKTGWWIFASWKPEKAESVSIDYDVYVAPHTQSNPQAFWGAPNKYVPSSTSNPAYINYYRFGTKFKNSVGYNTDKIQVYFDTNVGFPSAYGYNIGIEFANHTAKYNGQVRTASLK